MKLTALPVRVGDSFFLTNEDKIILVDGGMNKQHILSLLRKERIPNNQIDLLVCTHYDADHINGIIGILESQKYSFKEIWLPEILGSIGYTLSKNTEELFINIRKNGLSHKEFLDGEESIFEQYESSEINVDSPNNNSLEEIDCGILEGFGGRNNYLDFELYCGIGMFYENWQYKLISAAKSVANLISQSLGSGAYIRWFKYQKGADRKTYGFDMYCENSIQTDISIFDGRLLFRALYAVSLSKINKYSLVYLHRKSGFPDILFTADSDLSFYSSPVVLAYGSIVTSPHHGSRANDAAYSKISGHNLIYVRSDRSQRARPGTGYTSNKVRFCTICRNKTPKQKVEFNYNGYAFNTKARVCIC